MKLIHIETKYEGEINLPEELLNQLPKKIMLSGTIQFREQLPSIQKKLEAADKQITLFRGVHDKAAGQMLGCDIFQTRKDIDAFLYIGDGLFHPTAFLYSNAQTVFYYNPFTNKIQKLTQQDLQKVNNRRKANYSKFQMANKIGILVSTKPGQNNIKAALELKNRLTEEQRQGFIFISETLDINQLENFPFVECWVNTACPRIIEDTSLPMVNIWDLRETIMKGVGIKVV
jgi:2-(3-amino-3-carboxypropyl)histidine synthase